MAMRPVESLDLLQPVKSEEFLPSISRWVTLGGLAIVSVFGVGLILAATTPYITTVKAPAVVRPSGDTRLVQVAITGTVRQILVQEGALVQQGSLIAVLDASPFSMKQQQLAQTIQTTRQQQQQIAAQIQALEQQITAESRLINRTIAASQANLNRNKQDYQSQQITTQAQVQEAEAAFELAQTEMQHYQQLANTGAVAELQVQEKVQALKAAQARLERAKAALHPSDASITIAAAQIQQNRAQGESTLASFTQERAKLIQQQLDLQNQLDRDQKQLQQLQHDAAQSMATAPIQGKILKLALRNLGQVVQAGDTVAQIVPTQTPLLIKARVPTREIAQVQVCRTTPTECIAGQVQMRISAYPYPDYGTLPGRVTAISADAIVSDSEVPYYEVIIQPERSYLERQDQHYEIQPGMELTAEIVATRETVLTFILRKTRLFLHL